LRRSVVPRFLKALDLDLTGAKRGAERRLGLNHVPHVPRVQPKRFRRSDIHIIRAYVQPGQIDAVPSQGEGPGDDNADYQTAYQSAHTVGVNEGRRRAIVRLRASSLNRPTVDGMEAVRDSSLAAPEIQPRRLTREAHARGRCLDGSADS
jgi:hypothetical protein